MVGAISYSFSHYGGSRWEREGGGPDVACRFQEMAMSYVEFRKSSYPLSLSL